MTRRRKCGTIWVPTEEEVRIMATPWHLIKRKSKAMNPSLLQRPVKVEAMTKVLYIYAPSVLTEGSKLEPGTIIKVLEVHKGKTKDETMLKVVTHEGWRQHVYTDHRALQGRTDCDCTKDIADMTGALKKHVFFVLLSDIGK